VIFRTFIQDGWSDWHPLFVRELRLHAKWVVVRVPGLFPERLTSLRDIDGSHTRSWEGAMKRCLAPYNRRVALCVLVFRRFPHPSRPLEPGQLFCSGDRLRTRWAELDGVAERLSLMVRLLRAETGCDLALHVEDFSARWAMLSDIKPGLWIMDNPFIGAAESSDQWSRVLSAQAVVRHSDLPQMARWHTWRHHLRPAELLHMPLGVSGRHGLWTRRDRPTRVPLARFVAAALNRPDDHY